MKYAAIILALLCGSAAVRADDANSAYETVITHQMEAITHGDAPGAWGDASPNLHIMFPDPQTFMGMVQNGYAPIYSHKRFTFESSGVDPSGRSYQMVQIEAADGVIYEAIYFMEQQADGSWKISGCVMVKAKGDDA